MYLLEKLEIITLVCGLLAGTGAVVALIKFNLHMFQLNGYKNGEHLHWIKKNARQFRILTLDGVLALAAVLLLWPLHLEILSIAAKIVLLFYLVLTVWNYRYLNRSHTKKKLVYTSRVKRLLATELVVLAILIGLAAVLSWFSSALLTGWLLIGVVLALMPCLPVVCNFLNSPMEKAVNQHFVNDALSRLRQMPDMKIIGITGSYGKTSVKFYLKTLLEARYSVLMTPESFNTPMGVVRTIREHLRPDHEIFLCEMGARHVGDIKEICDMVHPDWGVITSIGPQHLETFFTMENIVHTKFEVADALPDHGTLFLNGDCSYITDYCDRYPNRVLYSAEEQRQGGYYAKDIRVSELGTDFTVVSPEGEEDRYQTRLIGGHNVINLVGAIAVAHRMGIPLEELKVPVRRLQPVPHRLQMRQQGNVTIIDDAYNSNPVGSKAAVETLAMFEGVRILVTPGMVELGDSEEEYNYKFGTYAAGCCDYVALVGERHTRPIREGLLAEGFDETRIFTGEKLEDALQFAYGIREQGHKYILLENDLPDNY